MSPGPLNIESLDKLVQLLHDQGAYHVNRGYRLNEAGIDKITNSLLEEAVEFQAECLFGNYVRQASEAGDLLGALLHALYVQGIPLNLVIVAAGDKLKRVFTTDPSQVKTVTPGFNRSNRPTTEGNS